MKLPPTISASDRQYAQLRAAQRIAQIGSWELNIPDNSLNWSEETYRIFGISPTVSDITADNFFAVVHPEDIHDVLDAYHHARNTESNIDIVNRIVRPDGEVRHLHSRAEYQVDARGVARLCGTVQDVTARVVSEQKLTDSDHLLKFASAMVRMGTWNVDLATSRVTWSDEVCDIHEVPRGTVPNVAQAMDFYLPDSRAALELAFAECATAGAPFDMELQVVTATGHGLWVRAVGQAVRAEDRSEEHTSNSSHW